MKKKKETWNLHFQDYLILYPILGECRSHFGFALLNVLISIVYYWSIKLQ